jgi:uncharacterized membrane protein YkvA (DUF1232 family)
VLERLKSWAAALKREALVLWFASRDPRALSMRNGWPCSSSPMLFACRSDTRFHPIIGFLDEIILLPGAIWLTLKLMPQQVLLDARARALAWLEAHRPKPRNWIAAAVMLLLWVVVLWALWAWLVRPRYK